MAIEAQTLGRHSWTPHCTAALVGVCPDCGKEGEHEHTEFSGGDGEVGYVEWECAKCDSLWTDEYRLVTRTIFRRDPSDFDAQVELCWE